MYTRNCLSYNLPYCTQCYLGLKLTNPAPTITLTLKKKKHLKGIHCPILKRTDCFYFVS